MVKGKNKFEKTDIFDASIHEATTYIAKIRNNEVTNRFQVLTRDEDEGRSKDSSPLEPREALSADRMGPNRRTLHKSGVLSIPSLQRCPCMEGEKCEESAKERMMKRMEEVRKRVKLSEVTEEPPSGRKVNTLTKSKTGEAGGNIAACSEDDTRKWKCISIAVDSGACDSVISPEELPAYTNRIRETKDSKSGNDFISASGDPIPNYGELTVPMFTRESTSRAMKFQAAGVAKPLGSVKRMIMAHHRVVFDEEGSFIENKLTGEINMLREEDGNFMLDVWVPPPEVMDTGFTRQP